MSLKYRKEILIAVAVLLLCFISVTSIKKIYFNDKEMHDPIQNVLNYYNDNDNKKDSNVI